MKLTEDLRELHALLKDGILTEEEFEAQKAKLLAGQEPGIRVEPEEMQAEDDSKEEVAESTEPIGNASLEETDDGLRFRTEADVPDDGLIKLSIGLPTIAFIYLFAG